MFSVWTISLLLATGLVAGFVDSVAGGGGLITLPVLLTICPDPAFALGTNKLQASFGSGSAAFHYARGGAVDLKACRRSCALAFTGSLCGSWLVQHLDPDFLKRFVPVLLIGIALYMMFRPQLGEADSHPRLSRLQFDLIFALGIGFYDGFLGPGTGTFLTMAFMLTQGLNLASATANTKPLNFASNLASLLMFLWARKVWFAAGLLMGCGQALGSRMGSKTVLKRGTRFVRPVFLGVVLLLTANLVWKTYLEPASQKVSPRVSAKL